jgi:hypothetical protein
MVPASAAENESLAALNSFKVSSDQHQLLRCSGEMEKSFEVQS